MRDLDLNDLRVFVRVVDRGGFAVAARELRVPTSTVSRTIARLEASTGTRLLQRTPRSVHATSEGRAIYSSVSEAVATLERAARALEPATRRPKGVLRVTAPTEIGSSFLADVAVAFCERSSARADRPRPHEPRGEPRRRRVRRRLARGDAARRFVARREEAGGARARPLRVAALCREARRPVVTWRARRSPLHRLPRQRPREDVEALRRQGHDRGPRPRAHGRRRLQLHPRGGRRRGRHRAHAAPRLREGRSGWPPRSRAASVSRQKGRRSMCCTRRRRTSPRA